MKSILIKVYQEVFHQEFDISDITQNISLHSIFYLLDRIGIKFNFSKYFDFYINDGFGIYSFYIDEVLNSSTDVKDLSRVILPESVNMMISKIRGFITFPDNPELLKYDIFTYKIFYLLSIIYKFHIDENYSYDYLYDAELYSFRDLIHYELPEVRLAIDILKELFE